MPSAHMTLDRLFQAAERSAVAGLLAETAATRRWRTNPLGTRRRR